MRASNILETIGNTPHVRLNRLFPAPGEVWMKLERANPGGSIKDRIGLAMIEDAERRGVLGRNSVIIEPTSGNTGIGLAMVAAVKGYQLVLVMPESMSIERRRIMAAYGATLVLTPREKGMKGAIERAQELAAQTPGAWMPQQFENPANIEVHRRTTAAEILADFPEGHRRAHHRRRHRRAHHRGAARCSSSSGRSCAPSRSSRPRARSSAAARPARTASRASAPASSPPTCTATRSTGSSR